jgi:gamma-glutamyltranspeptidase/glutathione hydrolase
LEKNAIAREGMVASSHPLAVSAGLEVLDEGGSAADAAIATAAVLCVVDPRSTGIGGDAFALYWEPGAERPIGLGAAGVAPGAMSIDALHAQGFASMPAAGPWSITVPGAVAGWRSLHERFGSLRWARLLRPAIELASDGFEVTPVIAEEWATTETKLKANDEASRVFLPDGKSPTEGQRFVQSDLARSLEIVAEQGPDRFYKGEIADAIGTAVEDLGGPLRAEDLAAWDGPEWVSPIARRYRSVGVFEFPPPGQGLIVLQALGIYEKMPLGDRMDEEHAAIESIKLGFADAQAYIADPLAARVAVDALLNDRYLDERRASIDMDAASEARAGRPSDTVYLAVVDRNGAACSFIQSLYEGFGSGVVAPGTGITLQNRGANFSLDPHHPNHLEPGKRPYHTIIPAMLGDGEGFAACLGVVGGFQQPQGQFQIVRNVVDRGLDPQAAIDAPRWRYIGGREVAFEPSFDQAIVSSLEARGHQASKLPRFEAGGAQMILRRNGDLIGGSDRRKDGVARGL